MAESHLVSGLQVGPRLPGVVVGTELGAARAGERGLREVGRLAGRRLISDEAAEAPLVRPVQSDRRASMGDACRRPNSDEE
jgi:hypothetical protein